MTLTDYLTARPIYHPTTLAALKKSFYAAGGEKLGRSELLVSLGAAGYRVRETRLGYIVESASPRHPASTEMGWVQPTGSHLLP